MTKTEILMSHAIRIANERMQQGHGGPFGAIVVKDGIVIAEGFNAVTSLNDPTAHAEVQAIRNACIALGTFQLTGCEVYSSCEPCPMCLGALYWARPDKIYFACTREDAAAVGFDDEFIYKELAQPVEKRTRPMIQLLRDEGLIVFREWEKKLNKISY